MEKTEMNFTDVEFLSANEKKRILADFKKFIKALIDDPEKAYQKFTDRLYKHLSCHCGFIAHYDRSGYFSTYFRGDIEEIKSFVSTFQQYINIRDYWDINTAMNKVLKENLKALYERFDNFTFARDFNTVKLLMQKHKISKVVISEKGILELFANKNT